MNYSSALSNEQIMRYAPSAFATQPYHARSDRYTFIPTSAVIDGMRHAGFLPASAQESRTRIADKRGYTKHMIRFRSAGSLNVAAIVGDSILEAVLINSHDGASRYKLMCGVFRFVCTNGMVVSDSMLESINIKHMGDVIREVVDGTARIFDNAPKVTEAITRWRNLELKPAEAMVLAEAAHTLRFPVDEETGKSNTAITPEMLLRARRSEDKQPDLWHTFNRVQENALKGIKKFDWSTRTLISSRRVKSIDGDVKLNRALWQLAEKMAELKAA